MSSLLEVELWRRAETLFEASLDRQGEDRLAFIRNACGKDEELLAAVESLLAQDEADSSFLGHPLVQAEPLSVEGGDAQSSWIGRCLGAYELTRSIGAGGMGLVFSGERADGEVERQVAVKVLTNGLRDASMVRALRRERQILASFEHPNIARFLDGGTTDEGIPYVVLEYVDGMPLTEYCDLARLGVRDRIELFRKVCSAVDYAHRRLVVHRDLKPGNLLVTDAGEPKLLDFGIAKLLDSSPISTGTEEFPTQGRFLTLSYASPEQMAGYPVSTASDIYSMGVLLYELLTGLRPRDLGFGASRELMEGERGTPPLAPSEGVLATRGSLGAGNSGAGELESPEDRAEARSARAASLSRQLTGDLDSVVVRCLRSSPEKRYRSVADLDEDLRRFLVGWPLLTRPARWSYRWGKFIRRNAVAVACGALAVAALIGWVIGTAWQSREVARERTIAEQARVEAEEVSHFLTEAFRLAGPYQSTASDYRPSDEATVRDVLEYSASRIGGKFAEQPVTQARLLHTIAEVYTDLGKFEQAAVLHRDALSIRRRQVSEGSSSAQRSTASEKNLEVAESLNSLGVLYCNLNQIQDAKALFDEALEISLGEGQRGLAAKAESLTNVGMAHFLSGELSRGESLLREALHLREEILDPDDPGRIFSHMYLGQLLSRKGFLKEAQTYLSTALDRCIRIEGEEHVRVATLLGLLGDVLMDQGEFGEAEPYYRRALATHESQLGKFHPDVIKALEALGLFLSEKGDTVAAEETLRLALRRKQQVSRGDRTGQSSLHNKLGILFLKEGEGAAAEGYFRQALEIAKDPQADEWRNRHTYLRNLGIALRQQKRMQEAEVIHREAVELLEKEFGSESPRFAFGLTSLASTLVDLSRCEEGEQLAIQAEGILTETLPEGHFRTALARGSRGDALRCLERFEDAESLLVASLEVFEKDPNPRPRLIEIAKERLSHLYESWGKPEKARRFAPSKASKP